MTDKFMQEWDDLCQQDQEFIESITKYAESSEMDANIIIGRMESIADNRVEMYKKKVHKALKMWKYSEDVEKELEL